MPSRSATFNISPTRSTNGNSTPAWYGMDMGVVSRGQGRYVLSALRIVENFGADPVADKILFSLIERRTLTNPRL